MECPLYAAYMLMGAIGPDKTGLRLSERDSSDYQIALHKRRRGIP